MRELTLEFCLEQNPTGDPAEMVDELLTEVRALTDADAPIAASARVRSALLGEHYRTYLASELATARDSERVKPEQRDAAAELLAALTNLN